MLHIARTRHTNCVHGPEWYSVCSSAFCILLMLTPKAMAALHPATCLPGCLQIAMVRGARQRRVLLQELIAHAPFVLPPMRVVSVEQLRELGCIPRFSSDDEQGYRPLPADGLPDDAVVVFMSHRWIGNGCPDDNEGTKLRQVVRAGGGGVQPGQGQHCMPCDAMQMASPIACDARE